MKISVIIPIYNQAQYIKPLLDCVLSSQETEANLEILAINDGSTDASLSILQGYKDNRLKVYSKENEGLYKTWKYGVNRATGDYIMFIDSDDKIEPNVFTDMLKIIEQYKPSLIQFGFNIVKNNRKKKYNFIPLDGFYQGEELEQVKKNFQLCPKRGIADFPDNRWTKVYKTDEFKDFLKFSMSNSRYFEDLSVTIPFAHVAKSIYVTHVVYYNYIIRNNSMCHSSFKEGDYDDYINLVNFFEQNKEKFNLIDSEILLIKQKILFTLFAKCVDSRNYEWAHKILNGCDNRNVILEIQNLGKLQKFMIKHEIFGLYRFFRKIKSLLN